MQPMPTELKQIYWRSRRGMLELELKLVPFVRDEFANLSPEQQATYEAMLQEEDWQLYDWLQGREVPQNPQVQDLVKRIIANQGKL